MTPPLPRRLQLLEEFLQTAHKLAPAGGGFSRVLKLDYPHLDMKKQFALLDDGQQLVFRYQVPSSYFPLSAWLAVMDDVTTWSLVTENPQRKRPGVSVHLEAHWTDDGRRRPIQKGDAVIIRSSVTKMGRNLGFAQAQILRSEDTNQVLCVGSHIKYLPMGYAADMAMGPLWPLTKWYAQYKEQQQQQQGEEKRPDNAKLWADDNDDDDMPSLEDLVQLSEIPKRNGHCSNDVTFHAQPCHANALGGILHGGCQAMVLEQMGRRHAVAEETTFSNRSEPQLQSMSVSYVSAPLTTTVELETPKILFQSDNNTDLSLLKVAMVRPTSRRQVISEGYLTWSSSTNPPSPPPPAHSKL